MIETLNSLTALGIKYGTDKLQHGYLPHYERHLAPARETVKRVLEIGVDGGASIRMWRDYFPNAVIIGMDHNLNYCKQIFGEERIEAACGDASHKETWGFFASSTFDLIIDDGSHRTADIITAFRYAWPLLQHGGLYAIEDMGCSYMEEYQRDNHHVGGVKNAIEYFKGFVDSMNIHPDHPYTALHFYRNLVIIQKR